MEVNCKRSQGGSYLILSENSKTSGEHYQKAIFLENDIPGLLPCKLQRLNGEESYHYDITGCQSLKNLFSKEKLCQKDLEEIFQSWIKICETLEAYLLNTDFLLLDPSYLYKDTQTSRYLFVWFPYYIHGQEETKEFQILTEFFLPRIDHKDKGAVSLGYGIYKEAVSGNLRPDNIKSFLYSQDMSHSQQETDPFNSEKESYQASSEELWENEEREKARQKALDDFYSEEEEETAASWGAAGVIFGILTLCILDFLLWHFRLLSSLQILIISGVLLVSAGLGACLYYFLFKKKREARSSPEPPSPSFYYEAYSHQPSYKTEPSEDKTITYRHYTPHTILPSEAEKKSEEKKYEGKIHEEKIHERKSSSEALTILLKEDSASPGPTLTGMGKHIGTSYPLKMETTFIGKWEDSVDICLNVPTVSRIHAKIIRKKEGCYITDLNSKNGTWVNGRCLDPEAKVLLKNNDILCFAREEFRYNWMDFPDSDMADEN